MKKKFLIMIAVITAVISCLWFFLKPAAKDPTLVTWKSSDESVVILAFRFRDKSPKCILKKEIQYGKAA